jgi:hypothetical protein
MVAHNESPPEGGDFTFAELIAFMNSAIVRDAEFIAELSQCRCDVCKVLAKYTCVVATLRAAVVYAAKGDPEALDRIDAVVKIVRKEILGSPA